MKYVDPTGEKVVFFGDGEEQAYKEYRNKVFSSDEYKNIQEELTRLEGADEVFRIRIGDNVSNESGEGNFIYNKSSGEGEFDVNIKDNTMGTMAHELKHADQYMDRKIGFDLSFNEVKPFAYDKEDEYEAYARQGLFGNTLERQEVLTNSQYKRLPGFPVTIDNIGGLYSFEGIVNLNKLNFSAKQQPKFIYHGWEKDIKK